MNRARPRNGTPRCRAGPQRPRLFVASERAGASRLQGLTWPLPSDPSRKARNASRSGGAYRLCRLAEWGSTTRQRRGAGGGHQAVNAVDLQIQETGEAAAAQQNREQQEAWREDRETASRREKAQAKGGDRCVSTGYFRPAGPPGFYAMPAARSCGSGRKPIQAGAGLPVFNYLRTEAQQPGYQPSGSFRAGGRKERCSIHAGAYRQLIDHVIPCPLFVIRL